MIVTLVTVFPVFTGVPVAVTPPEMFGALKLTVTVNVDTGADAPVPTVMLAIPSPPTPPEYTLPKNFFLIGRPILFLLMKCSVLCSTRRGPHKPPIGVNISIYNINKKRPGGRFLFVAFVLLSDYLKETLAEVMATFPK
jgi:hypothetical protein